MSASAALFLSLFLAAPPPELPRGVEALRPETTKKMEEMLAAAEKYRGLKALRPVPAGSLDQEGVKRKLRDLMKTQVPPEELQGAETALKAFGLIPESMDLGRSYVDLLGSQVAGFYDPEEDYMALIRHSGKDAGELAAMEDVLLVHELTHALQDQHFDLEKLMEGDPLSDAGTAQGALVEGDASLTMTSYTMGTSLESMPGAGQVVESMLKRPEALLEASSNLPGSKELASAPAWLRENLLFGYFQGMAFALSVRVRGGQKLLDYAFATDPPRSTEQILHPEKWHGRRDDPVAIRLPDLGAELPGWRKVAEGEMGELSLRILLREGRDPEKANAAAAGWGGDRFAVYTKGRERIVAWVTEWDSEEDAREALASLATLKRGWRAEAAGPRRVVATRGPLTGKPAESVRARLAEAPAEKPVNRDLDVAAITAGTPRP